MLVISILNPKGGVGKTTTAIHLARALQLTGAAVVLLDADAQASALAWSSVGALSPALTVLPVLPEAVAARIRNLSPAPDYVVLDGAARLHEELIIPTAKASNLVLIPVQPSALDVWACTKLAQTLALVNEATGRTRAAFVVSRQVIGTALANDVQGALEAAGLPVLSARLSQRVAYAEAIAAGVTVFEHDGAGKAAAEVRSLADEVLTLL